MTNSSGRRAVRDNQSIEEDPHFAEELNCSVASEQIPEDAEKVAEELNSDGNILLHADEVAYQWNVRADSIIWGKHQKNTLNIPHEFSISTHADLLRHIGRKTAQTRIAVIKEAIELEEQSNSYAISYQFCPDPWDHDNYIWIEERGYSFIDNESGALIARGVMRVVTEHKEELESLKYWSTRDEVTCQLNRPQLIREIERALTTCNQKKSTSVFLLAAVENLAFVNESYGYAVGDEVLAVIGQRFSNMLRLKDNIGRHSANKFGILLNECGPDAMQHVANRLLSIVRSTPVEVAGTSINITIAIGGVIIPDQANDVQDVLSYGHEALDSARTGHQNKFAAYRPDPQKAVTRARSKVMADDIMAALNDDRMVLALQPIVCSKTEEPAFHECLVRMRRESGELVSAHEIIPVVEKLGLTGYLDHRVLEMAINILREDPDINLSINVSGQTTSDHDWLIALHKLTQGRRDIRQRLIVEITESTAVRDLNETVNFVDTLKDLGCRVAIDDFGSGYTSFQNLRFFGVDMVKIDGSFVDNITTDPHNLLFVETLIDLARKFGLETVVEWVVDEEAADLMCKAGADYLQGSLYGMPTISGLPTVQFDSQPEK